MAGGGVAFTVISPPVRLSNQPASRRKELARDSARSLSLRDAQLALAREYGFAGWRDLVAEIMQRTDRGLELAAREAERVIHDDDTDRLRQPLAEHPAARVSAETRQASTPF